MNNGVDNGPGLFADLCGKLDLHIGAVKDLTDQMKKPPKRKVPDQPVFFRVRASAVAANTQAVLRFDLGGPDFGHFWYLRSLTIGGLSPTTTAAGRGDLFVTASNQLAGANVTLAQVGLSDWRDQAAALPSVAFYSRGAVPLRLNEELWVFISNATNGQQYVAAAQIEDFQEGANRQAWDL